ncbi:cytochrome c oxidase subunit 4 [Corynebacterium alimapuense]|uniref:Cytochrome c oxidase polypeptide 4 n=1 Tax=Corynebacterium alimapuense TaxID=1576874 RepID=A0A3M8K8F5_9CORY|nr:cytochrome c oxidase subunit 4 [Corynebacterium alimapuense]RNE49513.1 cytochrome-c oxidase [Corynebacterium alimapuense]
MRSSAKLMYSIAAFLAVMAGVYIFATSYVADDAYLFRTEWVGITALVLSFGLALMLGAYLHFTERRIDILPEDWEEAEVADKAGILGFYSPNSIWPATMAGAIMVLGLGIAFWFFWLIALGAVLLIWATTMLNLQYGLPKEKH